MRARVWLLVLCVTQMFGTPLAARHSAEPVQGGTPPPAVRSATLPVRFERNDGQTDPRVKFLAQGGAYTLFLTERELVLSTGPDRTAVRIGFAGAATNAKIEGLGGVTGRSNYLVGPNAASWRSGIPGYGRVKYTNLYPEIDLVLYGAGQRLEYDFVVSPRGRPEKIRLRVDGGDVSIDESGDARIATAGGSVVLSRPRIYQEIGGARHDVAGAYRPIGRREIGFTVGRYDTSRPLVIDPVIDWSTYLGGVDLDYANDLAVDAAGNVYLAGFTASPNFPTAGGLQPAKGGSFDAFVAKLNSDGTALVYATYLGGSGFENAEALTVDASGAVYVTGGTLSSDFPTRNPFQAAIGGGVGGDAFVAKIDPSGSSLVFSSYLGGAGDDGGSDIVVDANGSTVVGGVTNSIDFPLLHPAQPTFGGGFLDVFVTRLSPAGDQLIHSTYFGGSQSDEGGSVAIDAGGQVVVAGRTFSTDFPTVSALQPAAAGIVDGFFAKLSADGASVVFASYLGGPGFDGVNAVAIPPDGSILLTGFANFGFPTRQAWQPFFRGGFNDAFVTRVAPNGQSLVFSTFIGGSDSDGGLDISTDAAGRIWISGFTDSFNAPLARPVQELFGGVEDAYIAALSGDGAQLLFGTYLGGADIDHATGIGSDAAGRIYVGGRADSVDFPTVNALQSASGGSSDAFVARLSLNTPPVADAGDDQILVAFRDCQHGVVLDGTRSSDADGDELTYAWTGDFGSAKGPTAFVTFGVGTHVLTLTVSDGQGGTGTDTVEVIVSDTIAPVVASATGSPSSLMPPNHQMVDVTTSVSVSDICDPTVTCEIVDITSNEPVNGADDGNTSPDWEITGALTARLRAERSGIGNGRIYTIVVRCTDPWGNTTTSSMGTATITVPR